MPESVRAIHGSAGLRGARGPRTLQQKTFPWSLQAAAGPAPENHQSLKIKTAATMNASQYEIKSARARFPSPCTDTTTSVLHSLCTSAAICIAQQHITHFLRYRTRYVYSRALFKTGVCFEKRMMTRSCHCGVVERTRTDLDGITYHWMYYTLM